MSRSSQPTLSNAKSVAYESRKAVQSAWTQMQLLKVMGKAVNVKNTIITLTERVTLVAQKFMQIFKNIA